MSWKDRVLKMREEGCSWREIGENLEDVFPGLTIEQRKERARGFWRRRKDSIENNEMQNGNFDNRSIEYKSDGSTTFQGIIELMDGEEITPEVIMRAHNLDARKWDVTSYKTNFWQAQKKGGSKILLYQSKITVKPKQQLEITLDDIDKYFKKKDYAADKLPIKCMNYSEHGEILEICVADLHVGALCYGKESGVDYDLRIVKEYFFECINDIMNRCEERKFKKIHLITMGDYLHCDNSEGSTNKGTRQDCDSRISKIVEVAEDMLIDGITMLGEFAPVEYVYIPGNHDLTSGYILARSVKNAFRKDPNVTFDISPNPIKHRMFYDSLVMWHHGCMPKNNMDDLVHKHAREEFGKSKRSELHVGHLHDEITRTKCGTVIRVLPTVCESTFWEHFNGYKSPVKAITSFVWNEKKGLRDIWYSSL